MMHNTHILNQTDSNEEFTFDDFYQIITKKKYWSQFIIFWFCPTTTYSLSQHIHYIHYYHPNTDEQQQTSPHARPQISWTLEVLLASPHQHVYQDCQYHVKCQVEERTLQLVQVENATHCSWQNSGEQPHFVECLLIIHHMFGIHKYCVEDKVRSSVLCTGYLTFYSLYLGLWTCWAAGCLLKTLGGMLISI